METNEINEINEYLKKHILNTPNMKKSGLEKEEYIKVYTLYRRWFSKYIIEKLGLKEYDNQIKDSELDIVPIGTQNMDMYQYFSKDDLTYFYIRNDIYIDRLDDTEKEYIKGKIAERKYDLDEESKGFIERTYKKVIIHEIAKRFKNSVVFYGQNTRSYEAPSDALVIGARYDEFVENNLSDEEWRKLHDEQFLFLQSMYDEMSVLLEDKVDMPVSVISYNDYSIEKLFANPKSSIDLNDFEEI